MLIENLQVEENSQGQLEILISTDLAAVKEISTETHGDFTVTYYGERDTVRFESSFQRCRVNRDALGSRTGRDILALYSDTESAEYFNHHSDVMAADTDQVLFEGAYNAKSGLLPVYPVTLCTFFRAQVLFAPALYCIELLEKYSQPYTLVPNKYAALNGEIVFELVSNSPPQPDHPPTTGTTPRPDYLNSI